MDASPRDAGDGLRRLLPGGDPFVSGVWLAMISLAASAAFLFFGHAQFPGGAWHFTDWADAIAHGKKLYLEATQRDVGYPLLILLSGWPWTGSLVILFMFQASFSVAFPLMVYAMLWRISVIGAFIAGLTVIVSLVPYQFMKFVHHDQFHIFLMMLTVMLAVQFFSSRRLLYFFLSVIAALACIHTRPVSLLVFPLLLASFLIGEWALDRLRGRPAVAIAAPYFASVLLLALAGYANDAHRRAIFDIPAGQEEPQYLGAQLFYPVYINSADFGITISSETGPHTARIIADFRRQLGDDPSSSRRVQGVLSQRPSDSEFVRDEFLRFHDTDAFVDHVFEKPNIIYWRILTDDFYGVDYRDELLRSAAEIALANPRYVLAYGWRNLRAMLFEPGQGHSQWNSRGYHGQGMTLLPTVPDLAQAPGHLSETGIKEISVREARIPNWGRLLLEFAGKNYPGTYRTLVIATVIPMLLGFAIVIASLLYRAFGGSHETLKAMLPRLDAQLPVAAIASVFVFYHYAVVAFTVEPYIRYHEMTFILQVAAAFACLSLVWDVGVYALSGEKSLVMPRQFRAVSARFRISLIVAVALLTAGTIIGYVSLTGAGG